LYWIDRLIETIGYNEINVCNIHHHASMGKEGGITLKTVPPDMGPSTFSFAKQPLQSHVHFDQFVCACLGRLGTSIYTCL
jgi:hypothetical protein